MDHRAETTADPRRTVAFSAIAKALPLIIGVTVIFGAAGILLSRYQTEVYTAQGQFVLSTNRNFEVVGGGGTGSPARYVANQLSVLESRPVLQAAADALADGTDTDSLDAALEVSALADTDVVVITMTGATAVQAADRVNQVIAAYRADVTRQVTETATAATAATTDPLRAAEIAFAASSYGDGVGSVEEAVPPASPTSPNPLRNGLLLAVLSALVVTGLVVWRRGEPLADRSEMVDTAGAPVLGAVPVPLPRISKRAAPPLPSASDFSMVLVALGYVVADTTGVVLCSGVRRGSGTPTVALGLAAAAADQQRRVVVVDADSRESALVRHSGQPAPDLPLSALGDPSVPEGRVLTELVGLRPAQGGGSVHLASVTVDGRGAGAADALRRGLQRLVDSFDVVFLHAGPIASDPLAFALLRESSAVVAVVDEQAHPADLVGLREKLDLAGAACDGLVLTHAVPTRRRASASASAAPLPTALDRSGPEGPPAAGSGAEPHDDSRAAVSMVGTTPR